MKFERREFLELSGSALGGATLFKGSSLQAQRPLPKSEYDYVDWSWEKWRRITRAVRPRASGEQSGKAELIDLLASGKEKVTTPEAWEIRRREIQDRLRMFLGVSPRSKPSLAAKITEETAQDGHILRKLVFQTEPNEFVSSYLLVPKNAHGKTPVIVC